MWIRDRIDTFNKDVEGTNTYQVCGHRNPYHLPVQNGNFFLLEDEVEFGGHLRLAILDHTGWYTEQYQNTDVYKRQEAYCRKWCEENDLLSPIYTTATRGVCWFCHNPVSYTHLKTRHQYVYPHEESKDNDMTQVYEYLATRKISKETVDYCDIRSDGKGNIVFNYYDPNDVLTPVSYTHLDVDKRQA